MIEAELKARVADPAAVRAALVAIAGEPERATYEDTYLDRVGELAAGDRELRVRTVTTAAGARTVLTYKGGIVDKTSGSKSEAETTVTDRDAILAIVEGLGFAPVIEFTKRCENFQLPTPGGRTALATVVTVPELDGTFLEVETLVEDEADLSAALDDLQALLLDLGLTPDSLTTELYTDAVAAARSER